MKQYLEEIKIGILAVIAICSIILVIQGFLDKDVYVTNGTLPTEKHVWVDNIVNVDIQGVQGKRIGAHRSYTIDGKEYYALDVFDQSF